MIKFIFVLLLSFSNMAVLPDEISVVIDNNQRLELTTIKERDALADRNVEFLRANAIYWKTVGHREEQKLLLNIESERIGQQLIARQLTYHPIVLCAVILIVFTGLFLSYLQVVNSLPAHIRGKRRADAGVNGGNDNNTLEVSVTSLKVSSPVVGLVILIVSLAFFYLYLTQVYPLGVLTQKPSIDQSGAIPKGK